MPRTDDRDIAEAIGRIARDLQDLQEGNNPDEDLAVARDETETVTAEDAITESEVKSGGAQHLHTLTKDRIELLKELEEEIPAHDIGFAEMHE